MGEGRERKGRGRERNLGAFPWVGRGQEGRLIKQRRGWLGLRRRRRRRREEGKTTEEKGAER